MEIEPLEAALSARARALLPDDAHANLERLRALSAAEGAADTLDALSALERTLTERREALERAVESARQAEVPAVEVQSPPAPEDPLPFLLEEPSQLRARNALRDFVREVDAGGFVRRWGDSSYIARFSWDGAPFVVTMGDRAAQRGTGAHLWHTRLGTVAPRGFRPLRVHPRHALDRVKAWLHLQARKAVPLSSTAADARYVAEGPPRLVTALFDQSVCDALMSLAEDVDVDAGPGRLALAWIGAPLSRAHLELASRLARG